MQSQKPHWFLGQWIGPYADLRLLGQTELLGSIAIMAFDFGTDSCNLEPSSIGNMAVEGTILAVSEARFAYGSLQWYVVRCRSLITRPVVA
jgi:hypothetical protein